MVEGYRSISIRDELIQIVEKVIKERGYRSVADFVSEAVRLRLEQLGALQEQKESAVQ